MRKITTLFASMLLAVAALPMQAADEPTDEVEVKGTWFDISSSGNCSLPAPADAKFLCSFAGQWGAVAPTVKNFDPETDKQIVLKFAEALPCNFNMPWKNSEGAQQWGFGIDCTGKTEISIDVTEKINEFSIQNTQTDIKPSFTITEGYVVKQDSSEVAIGPWTSGWNSSASAVGMKSGKATINAQWSGVNISNDIIGVEGPKKLRIYTNSDITDFPIQWCIKTTEDKDGWPAVGKVNANYAETVINETLQSIYLQYTGTEPGTIDIKAITWELLPSATIANEAITVAEDAAIDENDGTFPVVFSYSVDTKNTTMAFGKVAYTLTAEGKESITDTTDIDVDTKSRNIYLKGLDYGTEYTLTINSVTISDCDPDSVPFVICSKEYADGELSTTFTTNAKEADKPELENGLIEIAQDQGKQYDTFTRTSLDEGDEYNTYTATGDLQIAMKMMNVGVAGCDYVVVKFAEPVAAGWKLAFWSGQDLVDVPEGATEFKYVFADDPKCGVKDDVLPQICMMTFFGGYTAPLEAKVVGVYKHTADVPETPDVPTSVNGIDAAKAANGKYIENGKIVLVKNGKKVNVAGISIK